MLIISRGRTACRNNRPSSVRSLCQKSHDFTNMKTNTIGMRAWQWFVSNLRDSKSWKRRHWKKYPVLSTLQVLYSEQSNRSKLNSERCISIISKVQNLYRSSTESAQQFYISSIDVAHQTPDAYRAARPAVLSVANRCRPANAWYILCRTTGSYISRQ